MVNTRTVRCSAIAVGIIACSENVLTSKETNQSDFSSFYPRLPAHQPQPTAIRSLFAHKPPTLFFSVAASVNPVQQPPSWICPTRLFNPTSVPAYTVRPANNCNTIEALMALAGLKQVGKTDDWQLGLGLWPCPADMKPTQRVNRFPGTDQLGNKAKLATNLTTHHNTLLRDRADAVELWYVSA